LQTGNKFSELIKDEKIECDLLEGTDCHYKVKSSLLISPMRLIFNYDDRKSDCLVQISSESQFKTNVEQQLRMPKVVNYCGTKLIKGKFDPQITPFVYVKVIAGMWPLKCTIKASFPAQDRLDECKSGSKETSKPKNWKAGIDRMVELLMNDPVSSQRYQEECMVLA
jgi:hypothetical protein